MDRVQKIREEVVRLQKRAEHNIDISLTEIERQFWLGESNVLTLIGKYIDTMQEEPASPCDTCPGNELAGTCASISELGRCPLKYRKASVWHPVSEKPVYDKTEGALNLIAVSGITKYSKEHFSMSVASLLEDGRIHSPISRRSYVFDDCYFTKWAYTDDLVNL